MKQVAAQGVRRLRKILLSEVMQQDEQLSQQLRSLELKTLELQLSLDRSSDSALARLSDPRAQLRGREAKIYSQNGEDGLLLHLFSRIGVASRTFFEFGIQTGRECNTANLSINLGWSGTLIEGDPEMAESAREYYESRSEIRPGQVKVVSQFVTAANIDSLLREHVGSTELDLLSIDIDGNDYWVWEAAVSVNPRVVVIEYNALLGPDQALAVKYDPAFRRREKHPSGFYFGASIAAMSRLGEKKGYLLAGCDSKGVNAFFVRKDLAEGNVKGVSPAEAYYPLTSGGRRRPAPKDAFAHVAHMEWVSV